MALIDKINVGGTAHDIQGLNLIGSCDTPAGTAVKVCSFDMNVVVRKNIVLAVKFNYANTYGDGETTYPQLQIDGVNYAIRANNGSYAADGAWSNGALVLFVCNGDEFIIASADVVGIVEAAIAGITPASIGAQPSGNYATGIRLSGNSASVVVLTGSGGEIGRVTVNNVAHAGDATDAANTSLVKLQGDGTADPDTDYSDSGIGIYRATNRNIGWVSNDGMIIHIPWSAQYAYQIAVDDQSDWIAVRSKAPPAVGQPSVWTAWDRLIRASELKASALFKTVSVPIGTISFSPESVETVPFQASAPTGYMFVAFAGVQMSGYTPIFCVNEPDLNALMLGETSISTVARLVWPCRTSTSASGGVSLCFLCMKQY